MKKSNKWLIALLVIVACFYTANMAYHKYNFENNTGHLDSQTILDSKRDLIQVVHYKGSKPGVDKKYFFTKSRNSHEHSMFGSVDQNYENKFYRSLRYKGDTLIVLTDSVQIVYPDNDNVELSYSMANIKEVWYNGKLVKTFE